MLIRRINVHSACEVRLFRFLKACVVFPSFSSLDHFLKRKEKTFSLASRCSTSANYASFVCLCFIHVDKATASIHRLLFFIAGASCFIWTCFILVSVQDSFRFSTKNLFPQPHAKASNWFKLRVKIEISFGYWFGLIRNKSLTARYS